MVVVVFVVVVAFVVVVVVVGCCCFVDVVAFVLLLLLLFLVVVVLLMLLLFVVVVLLLSCCCCGWLFVLLLCCCHFVEFVRFSPLHSDISSGRTPSLTGWGRGWGCFLWVKRGNAVRFSVRNFFFSGVHPLFLTELCLSYPPFFRG